MIFLGEKEQHYQLQNNSFQSRYWLWPSLMSGINTVHVTKCSNSLSWEDLYESRGGYCFFICSMETTVPVLQTASWVHSLVNSFPFQCINPSFQFMLMGHGSWIDNYQPTCKPCHHLQRSCVDCCGQEKCQLLELITTGEHEPALMPKTI